MPDLPGTADIRQFLFEFFSDEELSTLCFDFFPEVHDDFTTGMTKQQKTRMLLEYCQHREVVPNLLGALQRARPEPYERRFPQAPKAEARPEPVRPVRDPKRVFISHAHEDAKFAHQLAHDLKQHGWRVWIAPDSIRPGEKWAEAIERGLSESGVLIVALTCGAVQSHWVRDETFVAIELEKKGQVRFVPLAVEPCDVPYLWGAYQRIPFEGDYGSGLTALLDTLEPERRARREREAHEQAARARAEQVEREMEQRRQAAQAEAERRARLAAEKAEAEQRERERQEREARATAAQLEAARQAQLDAQKAAAARREQERQERTARLKRVLARLRDPLWQGIGAIVAIAALAVALGTWLWPDVHVALFPPTTPIAALTPAATKTPAATQPPAAPASKYKEAPMLAELVKAGKLPPVDQRLPENPAVVEAAEVGQYGGIWHRGILGPSDFNGVARIIDDALVVFAPDGGSVVMKYAESVTSSPDFKSWTVKLRKGSKWSNGDPFTTDDIMFWYKDALQNKDLVPSPPGWMKNKDGSLVEVKQVDDVTVQWNYQDPHTTFLFELANAEYGDKNIPCFLPSKFLKQFHASYAKKEDLDKMVADAKFKTWAELFLLKISPYDTPERPGMAAWVAAPGSRISDQIFKMVRNPYFVGVDKAGNQLPYMDEVDLKFFADTNSLNLAAIAGELDEQERQIQLVNYPVLKETSQKNGKYNIYLWQSLGGADADVIFNQTYAKDPDLGKLMANKDFRIAMSYAINRKQIQDSAFLGTGEPRQPVPKKGHPYYPGDDYAYKYIEYNPTLANQMLDKLGLDKKDADGYRLFPSGKRVAIELSVVAVFGSYPDIAQLIAKDFQKVGIQLIVQIRERALHFSLRESNDLQAEMWNQDTAGFPFTGSTKYDVRSGIYGNITYGPLWYNWVKSGGKEGVEPPDYMKQIMQLVDHAKTVGPDDQAKDAQQIMKIWVDNMVEIGTVGLTATDQGVVVVNTKMHNVPQNLTKDWPLRTPGNGRPETWFFVS